MIRVAVGNPNRYPKCKNKEMIIIGNVSSNSLFQFMKKFEYLEQALEGKLYPRYYKESLKPFFPEPVFVGMKCFCDIPLSVVGRHTAIYGEYALGFNKKWAIDNSINPITYYNVKSDYIKSIRTAYNENIKMINKHSTKKFEPADFQIMANIRSRMQESFLNFKPISGKMWRDDKWIRSRYFYNEREWRYITRIEHQSTGNALMTKFILESDSRSGDIETYNQEIKQYDSLNFKHADLNFIILKSDQEIIKISDKIDQLSIADTEKTILKTRIIKYSDINKNV